MVTRVPPASAKSADRSVYDVAVLQKALDVLLVVADRAEIGLSELSELTGASKASSYRVLSTLESRGFLVQDANSRKYSPGHALIAMAYGVIARLDLMGLARPRLQAIRDEFNETVNLGVLVENQVLYIDILESDQTLRMAARLGAKDPLHATALGKAILSVMARDEVRRLLKSYRRAPLTQHTIVSLDALTAELGRVTAQGYAVDDEENELGSRCVAVPLTRATGEVIGAISVSGPVVRMPDQTLQSIADRLMSARAVIESALGTGRPSVGPHR